jgi:hypothetical protein
VRFRINLLDTYKGRLCVCSLAAVYSWLAVEMIVDRNVHLRKMNSVMKCKAALIIATILAYQKSQTGFRDVG